MDKGMKPDDFIRCPFTLIRRLQDGFTGEIRYEIEIPQEYIGQAHKIEHHKGKFFVAVGPANQEQILRILNPLEAIDA